MVGMFLILIPYNYIIEENKGAKMDPPKKKKNNNREQSYSFPKNTEVL